MACALYPLVNGEKSLLYQQIKDKVKDRKLANFLYALSLQPEVKSLFTSKELNSQNEPKLEVFAEEVGIDSILAEESNVTTEAKTLGAVNRRGEILYFDNPNDKIQEVINFNDSHTEIKATIRHNTNGYYIDVATINAENFNAGNALKRRNAIYTAFMNRLQDAGLNTYFSPDTASQFNINTITYQIRNLKALKKRIAFSMDTAALIMDLFDGDTALERIRQQFGEDEYQAISQVSGWNYKDSTLEIDDYWKEQIEDFLDTVCLKMKRVMNEAQIDEMIAQAEATYTSTTTLLNSNGLSIRETLNDLYTTYFLDQDNIESMQDRCQTVGDAARRLYNIRLKRYEEASLKGDKNLLEMTRLKKLQKQLNNSAYLSSTLDMLQSLQKSIKDIHVITRRLDRQLQRNPESLTAIRAYSSTLLKQLDLVKDYSDVIDQLRVAELLEEDEDMLSEDVEIIDDIQDLANDLSNTLNEIEQVARKKQFSVVHSFLKIYWGEDTEEAQKLRGSDTTLEQIMHAASKDISLFDRFIYSVGTCSDEMMALIAKATKEAKDRRDATLTKELADIRSITKKLYDSGSDTRFMFVLDKEGNPTTKVISDYNYEKYQEDLNAYIESIHQDENISKADYSDLISEWINKHTKQVKEFGIKVSVPYLEENGVNKYKATKSVKERLSPIQYEYYTKVMTKKAQMLNRMPVADNSQLFDTIEISTDVTTALAQANGNPTKLLDILKNKFKDMTITREDDTEYSYSRQEVLEGNGMVSAHINARGEIIQTIPLHYTTTIADRSRVSMDYSRSLMAYMASSTEYVEMNNIIDALLLTKDFMLNRKVAQTEGGSVIADISKVGKQTTATLATKLGISTGLNDLAEDFFERNVYGKSKKNEGYLWGTKIRMDKVTDALTGYTSVTGLAVNALGAEANVLVGKLQMLIEAGLGFGGEFFNMKDLCYADAKYFQMLAPLLNEVASPTKSSLLGLLMEKFDVQDDFYEKIKETGFYKQPISKIIGNKSLFFLYGIGEHLLHAQTMIAMLHNKQNAVLDDKGNKHTLLEAFEVVKDGQGNGSLRIKEGWTTALGEPITEEYITNLKSKIKYANNSMHGAFGSFDKGMIHRYAFGRLLMNFRQWMPAHYSRRFRGKHWDADLGQYREGYYVSAFKFATDLVKDLSKSKLQIATRWKELTPMQQNNLRRAMAETTLLITLCAFLALLGPAKDAKGNWAKRHLIYELSRMQLETGASTPLAGYGFIDNILKLTKSPMASINTVEKIANILKFSDLDKEIQGGKHKGENKYVRNLEKSIPFYGQIENAINLGEENDLFLLFN